MDTARPIPLHIVFGLSAAGSLRAALTLAGRNEDVAAFADFMEMGPIDQTGLPGRAVWLNETLGREDWQDFAPLIETFWQLSLDTSRPRFVWLSRRSAHDFCGFLEWLRRNGNQPFQLIDLTDMRFASRDDPEAFEHSLTPASIRAERFVELSLWDHARPLKGAQQDEWQALWGRLRAENASVRTLTAEGLVSSPLDVFDVQLLSHVDTQWKRAQLIVGEVLGAIMYDSFDNVHVSQTSDLLLFARLEALVEDGALEGRWDDTQWQRLSVRRKS